MSKSHYEIFSATKYYSANGYSAIILCVVLQSAFIFILLAALGCNFKEGQAINPWLKELTSICLFTSSFPWQADTPMGIPALVGKLGGLLPISASLKHRVPVLTDQIKTCSLRKGKATFLQWQFQQVNTFTGTLFNTLSSLIRLYNMYSPLHTTAPP